MHIRTKIFCVLWLVIFMATACNDVSAQGVAINEDGTNADASSMLDVKSTSAGMLIPRMTQTQRDAIGTPATSLLIYQTNNDPGYYYYDGSVWVRLSVGDEVDPTWDGDANTTSDVGRTGNVGIGTTSLEDVNLHLQETSKPVIFFGHDQTGNGMSIGVDGSDNNKLKIGDSWNPASGTHLTIDDDGNVGVGTTSPNADLHTIGEGRFETNDGIMRLTPTGWRTSNRAQFLIHSKSDNPAEIDLRSGAHFGGWHISKRGGEPGPLTFYTYTEGDGFNERLRFDENGNVGIGTTSPAAQLHTTGSMRFANFADGFLQVDGSGNVSIGSGSDYFDAGEGLSWSGNTLNSIWKENGTHIYNGNSGNVGIGTTSPDKKLHIVSDDYDTHLKIERSSYGFWSFTPSADHTAFSSKRALRIRYQDSNTASITEDGDFATEGGAYFGNNVGIGTTSPASTLHVDGSVRFSNLGTGSETTSLMIDGSGDVSARTLSINNWDDAHSWGDHAAEGYLTNFDEVDPTWSGTANTTSDVERTGNVGIGTSSPNSKLHVNGDGSTIAFRVQNNGSSKLIVGTNGGVTIGTFNDNPPSNGLYVSGNVGIGTSTPSYKLHVAGRLKTDGINETSDIRLKKNINTIEQALDKVMLMRGVTYEWKDDNRRKGERIGLIAQEVEKILPEVVDADDNGYKSVQYSVMVALVI